MIYRIFSIPDKMMEIMIYFICFVLTAMWLMRWHRKEKESPIVTMDRRPLCDFEQHMMNLGRRGLLHIVDTVIFASANPMTLQNVEKAMLRLVKRHPLLRMKVKQSTCNKTTNDWFEPMDQIQKNVEELADKEWLDVVEKQLSEPGINREEGPLWHVKFLPNINCENTHITLPHQFALIFVFDHAICDGSSILIIINETLSYLEDELNGVEHYENPESLPLPKSFCDILDIEKRLSFSFKFIQLLTNWVPSIVRMIANKMYAKDRSWLIKNIDDNPPIKSTIRPATRMIPIVFDKNETKQFMKSCKAHSVSPFAALQAAMLIVLVEQLSLSEEVHFDTTVDVRPQYAQSRADSIYEQVAYYAKSIMCKITIQSEKKTTDMWAVAESCKHAVHDNLFTRVENTLQLYYLMNKIQVDPAIVTPLAVFVNSGKCSLLDRADDCPARAIAMYGSVPMHNISRPVLFGIHCICLENRFMWILTYSTNNINIDTASEIAKGIKQKLIQETA